MASFSVHAFSMRHFPPYFSLVAIWSSLPSPHAIIPLTPAGCQRLQGQFAMRRKTKGEMDIELPLSLDFAFVLVMLRCEIS
jgi:hypothetical protein